MYKIANTKIFKKDSHFVALMLLDVKNYIHKEIRLIMRKMNTEDR